MSCAKEVLPIIEASTARPVKIFFFISIYLFISYIVFVQHSKGKENLSGKLYKKFG